MANPQTENGYTKISNEILEALYKIRIPGEARQCLDYVLRKTYGFNKKEDMISLSQFQETGLSKTHICRCLNTLKSMNLITQKGNAQSLFTHKGNDIAITYCFNKDYEKWNTLPKKVMNVTQKGNQTLPKKVIGRYPIGVLQKTTIQKTTIQKKYIGEKTKQFSPPSKEEIFNYAKERNLNNPEKFANQFYSHYEAKGWYIGKNKMKNWRQAVITWEAGDWNIKNPIQKSPEQVKAEEDRIKLKKAIW